MSVHTAPVSPTAVLLVTLLVSWPGRQYDEVSREVIPICSSDYFTNSHLILPTTHQQGARERTCGSCSHGKEEGQERREWDFFFLKKGGMERIKKDKRKGRETTVSVLGKWEEQYDQSCVIRGYGWSSVPLFIKPFSKSQSISVDKNDFVCSYIIL